MRVLVVGAGYWGPNMIRNLARIPEVEVVGVTDLDVNKAQTVARQFPRTTVIASASEAFQAGYDAAIIVTPAATHFTLVKSALEAGLHVLVEKPLAITLADAQTLQQVAKRVDRRLMVGHVFHYKPVVRDIVRRVKAGELGKLCYLDSTRLNLGLFREDTNVLWDLATHDLTIFEAIFGGQLPKRVAAHGASHVSGSGRRQETMVYLTLDYGDEVLAHVHVNWFSPLKQRLMVIAGDKQMIVWNDVDPVEPIRIYDCGVYDTSKDTALQPLARVGDVISPRISQEEPLYLELQEFMSAIREHREPETDAAAGLRVVAVLAAATRSLSADGAFQDIIL